LPSLTSFYAGLTAGVTTGFFAGASSSSSFNPPFVFPSFTSLPTGFVVGVVGFVESSSSSVRVPLVFPSLTSFGFFPPSLSFLSFYLYKHGKSSSSHNEPIVGPDLFFFSFSGSVWLLKSGYSVKLPVVFLS